MSNYFRYGLAALIAGGVVLAGSKTLDFQQMAELWRQMDRTWILPLLLVPVAYLYLKSLRFALLMREVSGLPLNVMMRGFASTQATTLVPGGFAFRAGVLEEVGKQAARGTGPALASGAMDHVVLILACTGAAFFYPEARTTAAAMAAVAAVLVTLLAVPQTRGPLVRGVRRLGGRRADEFLEGCTGFLEPKPLLQGLGLSVGAFLVQLVALYGSLAALGLQVPFHIAVLAFVVSETVGRVSPTPGGVGVTEAGMVAMMAAMGGLNPSQGAAATLLFRLSVLFGPAAYGTLIYLFAWRGPREDWGEEGSDVPAVIEAGWSPSPSAHR